MKFSRLRQGIARRRKSMNKRLEKQRQKKCLKRSQSSKKRSSIVLPISLILVIILSSCATFAEIKPEIAIPDFTAVRPIRPVLEQVTIPSGAVIPDEMLRNYNSIAMYALSLEDYAWGGDEFGGLEKYIQDLIKLITTN